MDAERAKSLALATMRQWGLLDKGWKFAWNTRRTALGMCSPKARTVYLSTYFLDKVSEAQTIDTIKHEVAHALEFVRHGTSGHGPVWKRIAVEVGAKPKATCSEKIHHPYPYVIKHEGRVIAGFWKLPPNISERLKTMAVRGKPETKGQLKLFKVEYRRA